MQAITPVETAAHPAVARAAAPVLPARRRDPRLYLIATLAGLLGYGVFWLKALRQPTIDLPIRTHAGLITRIVETPGLWLSEVELGELVSQLRVVAAKTLPEESLTYGIFSGDRERLSRAIVTLISEEKTGRPIIRCNIKRSKRRPISTVTTTPSASAIMKFRCQANTPDETT